MAQPPGYNRQQNFTQEETNNPFSPISGTKLDTEFDAIKATLDAALLNIRLLQRDDGEQVLRRDDEMPDPVEQWAEAGAHEEPVEEDGDHRPRNLGVRLVPRLVSRPMAPRCNPDPRGR